MSLIIKELLNLGETALNKAGCMDARLDAELLMCHLLSINKTQLFIKWPTLLDEKSCEEYFRLVDIRGAGMPVQYILGEQEFMGISFVVNPDVLIPRQDTEILVEEAIAQLNRGFGPKKKPPMRGYQVLDLCCGSGAIGISLCKLQGNVQVTAADISRKALEVAKENARKTEVVEAMSFVESDLLTGLNKGMRKRKYHLIVSNPPYIESDVIPTLQREVAIYEPRIALDGGQDGLDFYRRIFAEAPNYLQKNGVLLLEMGCEQGPALMRLAQEEDKFENLKIMKDLAGLERIFSCTLTSAKRK